MGVHGPAGRRTTSPRLWTPVLLAPLGLSTISWSWEVIEGFSLGGIEVLRSAGLVGRRLTYKACD